ncbi:Exosome complex component rrp40 [Psilocybe cubensis]|uniref:Ribosomal RNA-processing protein 40 n=2 Tax=Psilocybe cubensis TaxID=181762 RepID=A0A8H7XTM0_PSICU|nr:Exosome complex component rrp40 [Psilocybe cubensis]KAH9480586.1 Exosome complex component rrp40 [Psilocybe cubensis]
MSVVFPGDYVPAQHVNLKLGPGLLQTSSIKSENTDSNVIATRAGILNHSANRSKWWIESNSRRYVPAAQELVIGSIIQKVGEGFRVDIGAAHPASLDSLAFEGATKRNKPNLKVGCLVYARVSLAHKDMEPELECFDAQTRKSEGFGELKGGFVVRCSLKMCRDLLDPKHFLLPLLGGRFPLEAAVGVNGRVWVSAKETKQTIAIARCIEAADPDGGSLDAEAVKDFLNTLDI